MWSLSHCTSCGEADNEEKGGCGRRHALVASCVADVEVAGERRLETDVSRPVPHVVLSVLFHEGLRDPHRVQCSVNVRGEDVAPEHRVLERVVGHRRRLCAHPHRHTREIEYTMALQLILKLIH